MVTGIMRNSRVPLISHYNVVIIFRHIQVAALFFTAKRKAKPPVLPTIPIPPTNNRPKLAIRPIIRHILPTDLRLEVRVHVFRE